MVTGKIEVNGGNGAGELTVELKDSDGNKLDAEIGEDGSFNVKDLSEGSYTVTVKKKGYPSRTQTVNVKKDKPIELDYELYQYGDADNNGLVNMKDLTLMQRNINGWDVIVDTAAIDLNSDGQANMKDLTILQRLLNGWNIKLD